MKKQSVGTEMLNAAGQAIVPQYGVTMYFFQATANTPSKKKAESPP
jgi:hypothetical protein